MRTNVHSYDRVTFDIKDDAQVRFDFSGVNRAAVASRELVNLVGTQTRIETILLENDKYFSGDSLLLSSQLFEITPERAGRP
jgi:hypothetical protein